MDQDSSATATTSAFDGTVRLAPFNPTSVEAQDIALRLLSLQENDVLLDLGCGDGRFLLKAASQLDGLRCVGMELDPVFCQRARQALSAAPPTIASRIEIHKQDVMKLRDDALLHNATAVFVYLLPKGLQAIKPILEAAAKNGKEANTPFRVVSYMFRIPGWDPVTVERTTKSECPVYLYHPPVEQG